MRQFNHQPQTKKARHATSAPESMNADARRQQGATLIVGVLILMLIVVGVFIIASNFMLTGRRTTGDQTSTMHAQYAADSGIAYADASFTTLRDVLEQPIVPRQASGANVTIAEFKTSLAKLCKSSPGTNQWDYAKNTDTKTVRSVSGIKGSMIGKSVCQVKTKPTEGDLDFFFQYYPKENEVFKRKNVGITTDADARDFLKKSLISSKVAVEYGEGVQQRSSRMLEPIRLTTIETGKYRLYFKIPDFESTGTFAKSTRKKVMSSAKTLYYLQIELPRGGKTDFFAYKLDQTLGPSNDLTGAAHGYPHELNNNDGFNCRDYFEGPVHVNTYFRIDPYACQGMTGTGKDKKLTGNALTGPVINGKFTSNSCIAPTDDAKRCKKKGNPNGFSYTYLEIENTANSKRAVVNTSAQKEQPIGNITAAVSPDPNQSMPLYDGPYSAGLNSNVSGFDWLPTSASGFGGVTTGEYRRYVSKLTQADTNTQLINKDTNTYGIVVGIDALKTALNDGTKVKAPQPKYDADYEPITESPKMMNEDGEEDDDSDEGGFYPVQTEANLSGIYIAPTIDRIKLSVEKLVLPKVENGKPINGERTPPTKAQIIEFTHTDGKFYLAYTKAKDVYIKVPRTLNYSNATLKSTKNKWVPAARRSHKKLANDTRVPNMYDDHFVNYTHLHKKYNTVAKIEDPIIYVQGSKDHLINLTGPERKGSPTPLKANFSEGDLSTGDLSNDALSKVAVADFTQMSVMTKNSNLIISGDLFYERPPCSLNASTSLTSCTKDTATGKYKYRNLLGIYSIANNVYIAHGEGNSTQQVTVRSSADDLGPDLGLRAPSNLMIDAFIMAPKGFVGHQYQTVLTASKKAKCRPEEITYHKGRVTFRGTVETKYIGHFKLGCSAVSQSYILDNRATQMTPPGFPNEGVATSKDTDNLTSLKVFMRANSDEKGRVSSANLIGEWKQARR